MARVTFVKHAQQRYRTVPVLNEDGTQKTTPVLRRDGSPKTDKRGKEIVRRITVDDKSQPLQNHNCDKCGAEIKVGDPYKWIAPKSGPYGGSKRYRCGTCPAWQQWEYSSSLSARLAQISHDAWAAFEDITSADEATAALEEVASNVRELAEEKRESAANIEEGFGHATSSSEELEETADNLDSWADEIEQADVPEDPEPEENTCDECNGSGTVPSDDPAVTEKVDCEDCGGVGTVTPEEPTEDQLENWKEELSEAFSIVDESPV